MCEFCLKHGEGKKWYLQASNYSDDLLSDIRRRRFIETFFTKGEEIERGIQRIDQLAKAPAQEGWLCRPLSERRSYRSHRT